MWNVDKVSYPILDHIESVVQSTQIWIYDSKMYIFDPRLK